MSLGKPGKAGRDDDAEPGELSVNESPLNLREMGRGLRFGIISCFPTAPKGRSFFYGMISEDYEPEGGEISVFVELSKIIKGGYISWMK